MCVTLKTNWDSVVGTVIGLWAAKQRSHGSILGRGKRERGSSLLQSVQRPNEYPMQCVCVCVCVCVYIYIYTYIYTPRQSMNDCDSVKLLLLF
jgi:hypothetical protein